MIVADYDKNSDVLYVALDKPCPAYSSEQSDGLLFRFSYGADKPCGVTVFDYDSHWVADKKTLANKIAEFLGATPNDVLSVLTESKEKP